MAQDIKQLIEKINQEGLIAAQDNAGRIEKEARDLARQITENAKKQAQELIAQARNDIRLMEEKNSALMRQSARDLLLSLRAEINSLLERLVINETRKALSPQELAVIIAQLIKDVSPANSAKVIVTLKKDDAVALENFFLEKLKEEIKKDIVLKPSADIMAGFTISFDNGKSHFDFSDKALAEYVGTYLKPKLMEILQSAV
jgi:V/A-type H+/Na+-transporting ATPase subunit E